MDKSTTNSWGTWKYDGQDLYNFKEEVATEYPLTIVINEEEFATIVCTPTNIMDLVIGFLASEGIIRFYDEISSIKIDETSGFVYVKLTKLLDSHFLDQSTRFIGSCCGKSRQFYLKNDVRTAKTILTQMRITVEQGLALMRNLQRDSDHFQRTGGVHNAALCTNTEVLFIRTDIGRHNALDKIYGSVLANKYNIRDKLIVFSGRVSSEVLLKISKIGVGILISKSAPTDLALKLADELGITVIGFARKDKMNIYTHPERVKDTDLFGKPENELEDSY